MKRILVGLTIILAVAGGIWFAAGGPSRTIEHRIAADLVDNGLPQPMAGCMAGRMATRLSLAQLRRLQAAFAQDDHGEAATVSGALESIRQIDDPETIEVAASSAALCAFSAGELPSR